MKISVVVWALLPGDTGLNAFAPCGLFLCNLSLFIDVALISISPHGSLIEMHVGWLSKDTISWGQQDGVDKQCCDGKALLVCHTSGPARRITYAVPGTGF